MSLLLLPIPAQAADPILAIGAPPDEPAGGLYPEQRQFVEEICDEADHLAKLVSNLLDLSRVEAGLLHPLRPRRGDLRHGAAADRLGPAVHPLHQPLARELLEVAVDGDRRHRMVARELGDRHAAVPLDALQDLCSAQGWRHGSQTRSSNALRVTLTCSGRNSSMAFTR